MHSFHHSRGRILFEVVCALVVAASCAGAWMQTGAWALLPAASVALLYGLIHAFDMAGRRPAVAVEPHRIDFAADGQGDLLAYQDAGVPLAAADQQLATGDVVEEAQLAEPAAPRASGSRRAKAPRKGGGRRASATKETKVTELAPLEVTEIASNHPEAAAAESPTAHEEVAHPHIEALFEPEPFVRLPRRAFGRKGG